MFLISTILVSCAPCPCAPCRELPPLATCGGGLFAAFLGSSSPPGPPLFLWFGRLFACSWFGPCFPCRRFVLGVVSLFFSCLAPVCGAFCCVCAFACVSAGVLSSGPCVPLLVWWGSFAVVLFLAVVGSPPLSLVASLPPVVGPLWCPGPVFVLVPPSGYLVAFATARLPCLNAWGVVVLCRLSSSCLMAAKAFGPVWGLCYPLHHVAGAVAVLCTPTLRYSSADDPGPPLNTAKLHCCHFWHTVWPTPLLSSSAFPAPSLPLLVCLWLCSLFFLRLPSLLSISPALTEAFEVWSSDCCESLLGLFVYVVSGCCISGKGKSSAR